MRIKPFFIVFLVLAGFTACAPDQPQATSRPLAEVVRQINPNPVLEGIEPRIRAAMNRSFLRKDAGPLTDIQQELSTVSSPQYARLVNYWSAYLDFQLAVFEKFHDNPTGSQTAIERGIATLDEAAEKNVEELNLLAFMLGFSTQFAEQATQIAISDRAQANVAAAMALNPDNLRTQYVTGCLDYYTPAEYGGRQMAEIHLRKATALPANAINSPYLPTWGKAEAYELLVKYYQETGRGTQAKNVLDEGLALYPDDHQLSLLYTEE
ncbi:MAG: hypothetical protein AAFZ52_15580 [Bacteroidota bacterium]